MQYRPTAAELLRDISSLLSDEVLEQVSVEVQHKVRVAANIARETAHVREQTSHVRPATPPSRPGAGH